jgi:tetratricopeptide (TPR) repeat protein
VEERFDQADALRSEGELLAAIDLYEAIARDAAGACDGEPAEHAAQALIEKASVLLELERIDEAFAAYDRVSVRYGDSDEPELVEQVAWALVWKAIAMQTQGRLDEAVALADAVVMRYADGDTDLLLIVGAAYGLQVECLASLGRPGEAIDVTHELARFADATCTPGLDRLTTATRLIEAVCLARLGRTDDALASYREIVDADPVDDEPCGEYVLRAACDAANMLWGLRRDREADAVLAGAIERFADEPEAGVRPFLAYALVVQARSFAWRSRVADAIATYDQVTELPDDCDDHYLRALIAYALGETAALCARAGDYVDAAVACRSLFDRFWDDPAEDLRHAAARAAMNCGAALCRLGEGGALLDLLATMSERLEASDDEYLENVGGGARYLRNALRPILRLTGTRTRSLTAFSIAMASLRRLRAA